MSKSFSASPPIYMKPIFNSNPSLLISNGKFHQVCSNAVNQIQFSHQCTFDQTDRIQNFIPYREKKIFITDKFLDRQCLLIDTFFLESTVNVASVNKHHHRLSDMATEPRQMLLPIQGYEQLAVVSLEEAIKPLRSLIDDIEQMVWIVEQNCRQPKDGLSSDEYACLSLYTMEWQPYEKSFCVALNTALRTTRREEFQPWFSYLRLMINALEKLPSIRGCFYRGIKEDLSAQYRPGETIVWWGFSSCVLSIDTLMNERFLGKSGNRTLFSIECQSAKNLRTHSFYGDEDEILLFPARQFEVINCLDHGNGLKIIQLRETQPKFPLIKFPSLL